MQKFFSTEENLNKQINSRNFLLTYILLVFIFLETCFFIFDSLLANGRQRARDVWHCKITTKKCDFSDFTHFLIIFLQNRSYTDVEFYGWKNKMKNMFLTDKITRKAFCVGGLFYPIIFCFDIFIFYTFYTIFYAGDVAQTTHATFYIWYNCHGHP